MLSITIQDNRLFMSHLLSRETFHRFELVEARVTTFSSFQVDGRIHPDYYDTGTFAPDEIPAFAQWQTIQPHIYALVRGHQPPLSMKIVLRLPSAGSAKLAVSSGIRIRPEQIDGLYLNITYDRSSITCTTGTALSVFTLDKSLDHTWDDMLLKFFQKNEIPYTLC